MYAINESNPSLRRMIAYASQDSGENDAVIINLPIFLQCVAQNQGISEEIRLKPHDNAKKSDRPFTSTLPSVVAHIMVCSTMKIIICLSLISM